MSPDQAYLLLVALPPLLLLLLGLTPAHLANRHIAATKRIVTAGAFASFVLTLAAVAMLITRGPLDAAAFTVATPWPFDVGVYFDHLAAILAVMIAFLAIIITRFAVRYLDAEANHGRFLKWISFTLGGIMLAVVSCNLVMFAVAWMLTSFGLHKLLTHYSDRTQGLWAARKKFLISRLGDAFMLTAVGLTWFSLGSVEYADIFAGAADLAAEQPAMLTAIALLFVIGAMTKSAQVPFHSWLPDTMETPTPVSALMHAGIINAGGFLVIRLSPLLTQAPIALHLLAVVGGITALFAAVVMLTQTSVKRSLAWSTIAQMGFMMLQCGLGAFSAALLHLVAHSAYKAHAFLTTGSVLDAQARIRTNLPQKLTGTSAIAVLPAAIAVSVALTAAADWLVGIDIAAKAGGLVLGLILVVAMTHLIWQAMLTGSAALIARSIAAAAGVGLAYALAFTAVDAALSATVTPAPAALDSLGDQVIFAAAALGFLSVFMLQATIARYGHTAPLKALYVHAANEFYLGIPAQRLTMNLYRRLAPSSTL